MSVMVEGRRIDTKLAAIPFTNDEEVIRRQSAAIGSERLRHAILTAIGIDPGLFQLPPPVVVRVEVDRKRDIIDVRRPAIQPITRIQLAVADYYEISPLHMKSAQRGFSVSHPRQIAMYLASKLTPSSLVTIGRMFGGRDHTTVLYAIRTVKERIETDPKIAADVHALWKALA